MTDLVQMWDACVAQCDNDTENGGGPTMVVAPVSTATPRRRSKSTGRFAARSGSKPSSG